MVYIHTYIRTPRSNPATYTGIFTPVRELFAGTQEARTRGYNVKTGVFSQTIEQTELYRIRDYTVKKPLKQRIFGLGTLEIISSDKTQPNIHLTAIKDPEGVADLLREGVELSRRATQTREVDFT